MSKQDKIISIDWEAEISLFKVVAALLLIIFSLFGVFPWGLIGDFLSDLSWPFYVFAFFWIFPIEANIKPAVFIRAFKKSRSQK